MGSPVLQIFFSFLFSISSFLPFKSFLLLFFSNSGLALSVHICDLLKSLFAASLAGYSSSLQVRERLYLLSVGYYRSGDYSRSRQLVERCLEVLILCFNLFFRALKFYILL